MINNIINKDICFIVGLGWLKGAGVLEWAGGDFYARASSKGALTLVIARLGSGRYAVRMRCTDSGDTMRRVEAGAKCFAYNGARLSTEGLSALDTSHECI